MNKVRDIFVNLLKTKLFFWNRLERELIFILCVAQGIWSNLKQMKCFFKQRLAKETQRERLSVSVWKSWFICNMLPHTSIPPHHFSSQATTETTEAVNNDTTPVRAPSPIVRPLLPGTMRPLSPTRGPHIPVDPRDSQDLANKKKKGLLSKGKKLLKKLSPVK